MTHCTYASAYLLGLVRARRNGMQLLGGGGVCVCVFGHCVRICFILSRHAHILYTLGGGEGLVMRVWHVIIMALSALNLI